jgi:hypothetical protein
MRATTIPIICLIMLTTITTEMNSKQSNIYGIVALYEDFSLPPEVSSVDWIGTTRSFLVENDQNGSWLSPVGNTTHLDTSWLAAPLSANQTEWNYLLNLDTDTNNQTLELILLSDKSRLNNPFNGYSVRLCIDEEKKLIFSRIDSGNEIPIYIKKLPRLDFDDTYRLKVIRKGLGRWVLLGGYDHSGLSPLAHIYDDIHRTSSHTGIRYWNRKKDTKPIKIAPMLILQLPDEYDKPLELSNPNIGDLIINEIMFNPLQSRFDGGKDQAQYVEIVNRSNRTLSLTGLRLRSRSSSASNSSLITFNFDKPLIEPNQHLVLIADTSSVSRSRVVQFFGQERDAVYGISNRLTLSLGSSSGSAWLISQEGVVLDSLSYNSGMHQPSVRDSRGVSLERISSQALTLDPWNWTSHAGTLGGSPGKENSIKINTSQINSRLWLSTSPNPFSPDGDGIDEVSTLKINTPSPGWLITAQIVDRHGRPVRTIASGERLGMESEIYWNGLDDLGRSVRTGIYVAVVEAWHLEKKERISGKHAIALLQKGR